MNVLQEVKEKVPPVTANPVTEGKEYVHQADKALAQVAEIAKPAGYKVDCQINTRFAESWMSMFSDEGGPSETEVDEFQEILKFLGINEALLVGLFRQYMNDEWLMLEENRDS